MVFRIVSFFYIYNQWQILCIMLLVLFVVVSGIVVQIWFFGWGIVLQIVFVVLMVWVIEVVIFKLCKQFVVVMLKDNFVLFIGLLLVVSILLLVLWWMVVFGIVFVVVIVKQLYGGLGYNFFNLVMIGYVVLLILFLVQMIFWLFFYEIVVYILVFSDVLQMIFIGYIVVGGDMVSLWLGIDGVSQVILLDIFKIFLYVGYSVQQVL